MYMSYLVSFCHAVSSSDALKIGFSSDMQAISTRIMSIFLAAIYSVVFIQIAESDASYDEPHFLYMQGLRQYLSDLDIAVPDPPDTTDDSVQGKLIATSIESQNSRGRGFSDNGFFFAVTNEIDLTFTIPKQSTRRDIPDVELWIFADQLHVSRNKTMEMSFLAKAFIPQANNERESQVVQLWNTNENCIALNLTILARKISRVLYNKNLSESTVRVTVEVSRMRETSRVIPNNTITAQRHDMCAYLSQRGTNDSFLVIKNYGENNIAPFSIISHPSLQRREVGETNMDNFTAPSEVKDDHCGIVPLIVNLTEVYGPFIKDPVTLDIKDCSGMCSLPLDRELFSQHSQVKDRLKLLRGGDESLSRYTASCTPVSFKPVPIFISIRGSPDVIIQIQDLVVDKCKCQ